MGSLLTAMGARGETSAEVELVDDTSSGDAKPKKSKKGKEKSEVLAGPAERPDPGPLAPWRLSIAVAGAAALTGMDAFDAAMSGVGVEAAMLRSFGVAFALWIGVGMVNKLLAQAHQAVEADHAAREAAARAAASAEVEQTLDTGPKPWSGSGAS